MTDTNPVIPYCSAAAIQKRLSNIPGASNSSAVGCIGYTQTMTPGNDPTLTRRGQFAVAVRSKRARQLKFCG